MLTCFTISNLVNHRFSIYTCCNCKMHYLGQVLSLKSYFNLLRTGKNFIFVNSLCSSSFLCLPTLKAFIMECKKRGLCSFTLKVDKIVCNIPHVGISGTAVKHVIYGRSQSKHSDLQN